MLKFITDSVQKMFGTKYDRDVKELMPYVERTHEEYAKLQNISNDELRNKTHQFRARIAEHLEGIDADIKQLKADANEENDFEQKEVLFGQIDDFVKERDKHLEEILLEMLPEAFAVVKETARRFMNNTVLETTMTDFDRDLLAKRPNMEAHGDKVLWSNSWVAAGGDITWNMLHYDVQLIGGVVLHQGKIAEMATGEGKTLVATLPAYLNGLSGEGVHLITVNDYLARRDCEWMTPIFEFLFLTIDCIDKYKPHSPLLPIIATLFTVQIMNLDLII